MLLVFGADCVGHVLGLQHILLTQQFVGFHVRRICAQHLSDNAFSVLGIGPAFHRLHFYQLAALETLGFFRMHSGRN